MSHTTCRFCATVCETFVDLGMSPLSNSYVKPEHLHQMEPFYPLHAHVCPNCFLVQLEAFESPQHIFSDYAYFSSYSDTWLTHCRSYAETIISRLKLGTSSKVIEIASNDGYLLQYFLDHGIPVLGIEPAANVAAAATAKNIPSLVRFFGSALAEELAAASTRADLLIGNNVFAHVPDINDFTAGLARLLAPNGVVSLEFPHLLRLIAGNQFDTIYHEHFSYLSLYTVEKIFAAHGLAVFDVEELPTHGGSLRVLGHLAGANASKPSLRVLDVRQKEKDFGIDDLDMYRRFSGQVRATKRHLLAFLIEAKNRGKRVVGYGAPAKGNTLLNYCGVRTDFLDFTVDRSPHKQGLHLPGTHIPIFAPQAILEFKPDHVLILPWNIKEEIMDQMAVIRQWGGSFVIPIPRVEVLP